MDGHSGLGKPTTDTTEVVGEMNSTQAGLARSSMACPSAEHDQSLESKNLPTNYPRVEVFPSRGHGRWLCLLLGHKYRGNGQIFPLPGYILHGYTCHRCGSRSWTKYY